MHLLDYKETPKKLLTPSFVGQIATLHEHKGKQDLYVSAKADTLSALLEVAKIQSTKASKRLLAIGKYLAQSMKTTSISPSVPTPYYNFTVTFILLEEKKPVDGLRIQIISSPKKTEKETSI